MCWWGPLAASDKASALARVDGIAGRGGGIERRPGGDISRAADWRRSGMAGGLAWADVEVSQREFRATWALHYSANGVTNDWVRLDGAPGAGWVPAESVWVV